MDYNKMTLLVDGREAFPEIIRCIEQAENSVEINMFIWRDDEIGNRMARAVLTAAERGAAVNISVDRYGVVLEKCEECKRSFFHRKQSFSEQVKSRTLELLYPENTRPGRVRDEETELWRQVRTHPRIQVSADVFKADHSKYYIIDDEILFLGGINIEDKENGHDICGRVYGDYMAKLHGREFVTAFREKLATGRDCLEGIRFGMNRKEPVRRFEMEGRYLDLINGAKSELHITMAYFSPLQPFLDAIIAAHRRGVRVRIVVPGRANFQNDSNRRTLRKLLQETNGGIEAYFSPRMLHTKLVMNEEWICFGSTNITKKAFAQLDELNLFVKRQDSPFCRALLRSVEHDTREAQRIRDHRQIRYRRVTAFLEGFLV